MKPASSEPAFRFVAGKGGVGKTTLAAARALRYAEAGEDVLVVSTDPAHSLGDALLADGEAPLSSEPRPLSPLPALGHARWMAAELAAPAAYRRWLGARRPAFQTLAERGTYLAPEDVARLLDLPVPGVDELVGLLELARLARASGCSRVVVDTAPTAHTLRLLEMPAALERIAAVLAALQSRHRAVAEALAGAYRPDEADAVVAELEAEARSLGELVRDAERCRFTWVLLPEPLSLAETRGALARLREAGVTVDELVVNRLAPPPPEPCPSCERRRRAEAAVLREVRELAADSGIAVVLRVPEMDDEPRGADTLRRLGRLIEEDEPAGPEPPGADGPEAAAPPPRLFGRDDSGAPGLAGWLDRLAPPGVRLLLFGGKGGVGKTTCAAAVALEAARADPGRPVLLLSTDPAHSLADVLAVPLGDEPRPVAAAPANLSARELDARAVFAGREERYREAVESALSGLTRGSAASGLDAPLDRAVLERLLEATPPGLDELVAIAELADALDREAGRARDEDAPGARLVVLDTAPTGHALRLLEMPELALEWDHALLAILLEYRDAIGLPERFARELVELSRSLKRLRSLLADPRRCRFVVVTRAGELPRRETGRLIEALGRLGIAVSAVVQNAFPDGACRRCRRAAAAARAELALAGNGAGSPEGWTILAAPAAYPPPRGVPALESWSRSWRAVEAPDEGAANR